ncbi:MAG: hypothetical protein MN733_17655, partial [Nitrososphaera sp.]|nr:hypothetical protein [Nitrososphaera sp.]
MAEPRLEEQTEEPTKAGKSANPLQSLLSRKVKIFGREFPMPLILLGAIGVGIVIFAVTRRRGFGVGARSAAAEAEEPGFGISTLPELAEASQVESIGDMRADLGAGVPEISPLEPFPQFEAFQPLPVPELPFSNIADIGAFQARPQLSFFDQTLPLEPLFTPIRDVLPSLPTTPPLPSFTTEPSPV